MEKIFYLFIFVSFWANSTVYSELQCYVCLDCPLPNANDLKICGATSTTSNSVTTTSATSASVTATTPKNPSPIISSTTVTDLPIITDLTTRTDSSTVTNLTPTVSENTSIASASLSTAITDLPNLTNSTTLTNSINVTNFPNISSFLTKSTATSNSQTNISSTVQTEVSRNKSLETESIYEDSTSKDECNCNEKCDCGVTLATIRLDEMRSATRFQCYKYKHSVNGTEVIDRGCKEIAQNSSETACSLLNAKAGCTYCDKDKCNSAFPLQFSTTIFICASFSSLFFINILVFS